MALITDPDDLNQGVEVTINTATRRFTLNVAGKLSADGVDGQALYSWFKEEWRTDAALIRFPFPMLSITDEQFEFVDDWEPANDATRNLIRRAGWREVSAANAIKREYLGVISLGDIGGANTAYFAFSSDAASTPFDFPGPVNQAVQTFGDGTNGNFDKRTDVLTLFIRIQGNTYAQATSVGIGLTAGQSLSYITRRFPLGEAADLKISATDSAIDATAPYTGMSITYFTTPQAFDIGGTNRDFSVVIDGSDGTAEQIYEFVQRQLRRGADIDAGAGAENGLLADELLEFIGDTLRTLRQSDGGGVYIDNFNTNDTNRLEFTDDGGVIRTFPFVAAGSITFNANAQADADAVYRMFFTTNPGGDYGTSDAILVNDNAGTPISGNVSGSGSVSFDFDYDGNTQGGRAAGTDADVTIVAIGLSGVQFVAATGTITRSVGQNFAISPAVERNYANAA